MDNTYIKLYRMLIKKPIWLNSTPEHKSILITLLLLANHDFAEWEWMGKKFKICPGQLVTSLESIRKKTGRGISIQNVRSCLKRLQKLDFVTDKATKAGRLITIINWDSYQPKNKKSTKIPTKEQQRSNKGATPNKNERTTRMKEEQLLGEFKTPSFIPENYQFQKNHLEYSLSKKLSKEQAEDQFEAFIIHHKAKGSRFKSWYAAFQNWIRNSIKFGNVMIVEKKHGQPTPEEIAEQNRRFLD